MNSLEYHEKNSIVVVRNMTIGANGSPVETAPQIYHNMFQLGEIYRTPCFANGRFTRQAHESRLFRDLIK